MKSITHFLLSFLLLQVFTANKTSAQTFYINENFSSASGSTPPSGWSSNVISAPNSSFIWYFNNPGSRSLSSPISGNAASYDSDWLSNFSSPYENVALESPSVNTTGSTTVLLKWDQYFAGIYGSSGVPDSITVEVYNGSSWNAVYVNKSAYPGVTNSPNIDVSAYAANRTGVKVRFRFVGWWSYWWIVDNVQLYAPPACSGTPAPGNTLSDFPFVCSSSTSFTLSLQNTTSGSGVSYQWQSSSNGTSWSNVSGATSATYTTTESSSTYYRCNVTCSSSSSTTASNPVYVQLGFLGCYCQPTSGCSYADQILNVTVGNLNNTTSSACNGSGYYNFSSTIPPDTLARGTTYPMTVTVNNGGTEYVTYWIDTNQNGTFDASEYTSFGSANGATISGNMVIPAAAKLGLTMMRFRVQYNAALANTAACSNITYGETEDYLVLILPQAPTATNINNRCGAGNAVCSVTSNTGAASPVFKWYTTASGGTAIAGQSGSSLSSYSISTTTTFYVSEVLSGYESPRVAVVANVNPIPNASVTSSTNPICYNASTGTATTTVTSGTSPFTYSWNSTPIQTSATATNLAAGNYICTLTDSKGCTDTATVTISNASPSTITVVTTNPSSATICTGTNTTFTATGTGLGTLTYQWWVNTGSGFVSMTDGGIYSGSATATLTLTNVIPTYSGYQYRCVITGTCNAVTTSSATLTVTALVPSVTVSANPGTTICQNTSVTFTANPTNGGSAPSYQWAVDGSNVSGATSSTYTTSSLSPGFHTVRVAMTSNQACTYPLSANSSNLFVTVNASVTPTISIAESPNDTICAGAAVTFTPTISNGGSTPSYQWKINGNNVATGTPYTTTGLVNGDVVSCVLTSNANCRTSNTANSNNIPMTVNPVVTPLLTIATANSTICSGDQMVFTSTSAYPGTSPTYQWKINGNNTGTNSATLTASGFSNNDVVSCVMTSNFACVVPPTATSNNITVTVLPRPLPVLTITANPDTAICTGTLVTFSTNTVNGGTNPAYQWKLNGVDMTGATSSTYSASVLNSGDIISCTLNSSAACATPQIVNSNALKFNVTPSTPPTIYIMAKKGNIINAGDTVTFNALVVNGGASPAYIWKKNGTAISGATTNTLSISDLENNDQVTLTVHSSSVCSNPDSSTSNSVTILINTGVGTIPGQALQDIKLYPNPNTGRFTIEAKLNASHTEQEAAIDIVNNLGQLVYKGSLPIVGGEIRKDIQLDKVASGTYFVRISVGEENFIERFVVQ